MNKAIIAVPIMAAFLPELIFYIYKFGQSTAGPTTKLYLYESVCQEMYDVPKSQRTHETKKNFTDCRKLEKVEEDYVQKRAAGYILLLKILQDVPALILGIFCGGWSDKVGRKLPMMLPCFGGALVATLYILIQKSSLDIDLKVPFILFGATINSCLGRNSLITMATHAYVCDLTTEEARTKRVARINSMNFFGLFAGALFVGLTSERISFPMTFSVAALLFIAALLLIIFFLPETKPGTLWDKEKDSSGDYSVEQVKRSDYLNFLKITYLKDTINVMMKPRKTRNYLLACYACITLHNMCKTGEIDVLMLFTKRKPLNWDKSQYGYLLAFQYANVGIMCLTLLPILSDRLKLSDPVIVIIFVVVKFCGFFFLSMATHSWMVYASNIFISTFGMIIACLKSTMSKLVDSTELGKTFALVACSEVISDIVGGVIFTELYNIGLSMRADRGAALPFYVMAALHCVLFGLAIYIAKGIMRLENDKYEQFDDDKSSISGSVASLNTPDADTSTLMQTNNHSSYSSPPKHYGTQVTLENQWK